MADELIESLPGTVEILIAGRQTEDPKLYEVLRLMNRQLQQIKDVVDPTQVILTPIFGATETDGLAPPANFLAFSRGNTLRFTWDEATNGFQYEVRKVVGTFTPGSWTTADLVFRTSNLQADIDPLLEGEHIYLIKTRNLAGTYSSLFSAVTVLVPEVSTIAITSKVIDNNILLSWTEPTSFFSVDHYDVYRNGVKVGTQKGTFAVYFEQIPGDFNYGIVSVDVAGNESVLVEIEVIVLQPPDFDLQDEFDSALDGDRVDVALLSGPKLLANVNLTETWEEHFVNNSYTSPADQIADGYPWYVQPTPGPGTYDEKIDFGTILNNVIVNLTYNVVNLAGTMTILVEMAASDDDITYSTYTSGSTQFFTSFRYIKIRLTFTGSDDHALVELDQLHLALNVKREVDAGQVDALAADVTGTAVTFNKDFKDIESLTATVRQTTTALIVVIDFVDVPDPTGFSVYVYDTGGTRQDATVDWKARGII